MPAGDAFSPRQSEQIRHAITTASRETGMDFSVFVGPAQGDARDYAQRLHAALGEYAEMAVLILVEPAARRVEIVTGRTARQRLDDHAAALASLSMATSFAGGDLSGGIVNGLRMLSSSAPRPRVLHEHEVD